MTKCPTCGGTGWETYEAPDENGNLCEYARRCTNPNCGKAQADRNERAIRSGIPSTFNHNVFLKDFDWGIYEELSGVSYKLEKKQRLIKSFVDDFTAWELEGMGLYIYSKPKGSGKTFLACCLCNEIINKYAVNVRFTRCADLLDNAKEETVINGLISARVLVLDDLGQKGTGLAWFDDVLFKIIDARYLSHRPTIITSNIHPSELGVDERTVDRINDSEITLELPPVPVRAGRAPQKANDFLRKMGVL